MYPAEYEYHQRLLGLTQLAGLVDTPVAHALSTSPAAVNAWRRRGRVPRAAVADLRTLLASHIGKPITDQGCLLDEGGHTITDYPTCRRAVEATGCHAPAARSHAWHAQRVALIALAALGPDARPIARAIGEPTKRVARWLRMARLPNERMADLVSKIRMARVAADAHADTRIFASAERDDGGYTQAVDDAEINARLHRLVDASGLRVDALAARIPAKPSTVVGWRNRRRVPPPWRAALADALSLALNVTVRADGLVADGLGSGWLDCLGRGLRRIPGYRACAPGGHCRGAWLVDRIDDALDESAPQARHEAMQQQALTD